MVLRIYDQNHSYDFSKSVVKGGRRTYVAPKKMSSSLPVSSSRSHNSPSSTRWSPGQNRSYGGKVQSGKSYSGMIYGGKATSNSPLLDVRFSPQTHILRTNKGRQIAFSSNLIPRKTKKIVEKRKPKALNVTEFFENSPTTVGIRQFEDLVYKSSYNQFDGLQQVAVRILLGSSNICQEAFANMVQEVKQQKEMREKCGPVPSASRELRDHWSGDFGLALFCPLDETAFLPIEKHSSIRSDSHATAATTPLHEDESDSCDDDDDDDDDVSFAHDKDLLEFPSLLSKDQIKKLQEKLPAFAKLMTWTRVYSLLRDGCCFETMLTKCRMHTNSIVVIKTTTGDLLGGYVDQPWSRHDTMRSSQRSKSFYGGGSSFLFASNPDTTENTNTDALQFYRWTGENNYSQICDVDKGILGMGGGGAFGWIVEDNFCKGSTGPSGTFNNPSLLKGALGGTFDILDVEIYGFKSMSETFSCSSFSSLGSLGI